MDKLINAIIHNSSDYHLENDVQHITYQCNIKHISQYLQPCIKVLTTEINSAKYSESQK